MERHQYLTHNDCYKSGKRLTECRGVLVHSTATPGASAERFAKVWDVPKPGGRSVCVHAFTDDKEVINTLPYYMRAWGCGGSGNNYYIQVEMCEPKEVYYEDGWKYRTKDQEKTSEYINKTVDNLVEFIVDRLIEQGIKRVDEETVTSHYEAHKKGQASNHSDPEGLLSLIDINMNDIRKRVRDRLEGKELQADKEENNFGYKLVKVLSDSLNIRKGPGTSYEIEGVITDRGVYTIVETRGSWGKLKSGAGWINISKGYCREL